LGGLIEKLGLLKNALRKGEVEEVGEPRLVCQPWTRTNGKII